MNALFGEVSKSILALLQAQDAVGENDGDGANGRYRWRLQAVLKRIVCGSHWSGASLPTVYMEQIFPGGSH